MMKSLLFLASITISVSAQAAKKECTFHLSGNDAMQFGLLVDGKEVPFTEKLLKISKKCLSQPIEITLKHVGKFPKAAMGHNVVVAEDANVMKIVGTAGGKPENDFIADAAKSMVLAQSKLIGGGESTSVTIAANTLKEGKDFAFFCSFPGHAGLMKGKFQIIDDKKKS